jgi:hypothetical protein
VSPVRYGQIYKVEFYIEDRTIDNVQNCDSYAINLLYILHCSIGIFLCDICKF